MFELFNKQTTADKVEDAVFTAYYNQIKAGNTKTLRRKLPVIGIAESIEPTVDETTGDEYEIPAIVHYDDSDENNYLPIILNLNKEFVDSINSDDLTQIITDALLLEDEYIDDTVLPNEVGLGRNIIDNDDNEKIYTIAYEIGGTIEEDLPPGTTAHSCSIDVGALEEASKLMETELEEEAKLTVTVDAYELQALKKTPTVVSKDNRRYFSSRKHTDKELETKLDEVSEIQSILDSAIDAAGMQKTSSETPDKRLNIRNVVIGHDKEYYHNKMVKGKNLSIVIVLDRSGSMAGKPSEDSTVLITAVNNLCHMYKELSCTILFSDDSEYSKMKFPTSSINSIELLNFTNTHCAEGIAENMDKEQELLEDADVVFVYTDGDIVSGNVDKASYTAKGIHLVGLYTATGDKTGKLNLDDYERHYNKNKAWFHDVIISTTSTGLAEEMADYMLGV